MSMTLEEQRIAIAEWSGKEYHKPTPEEIATGSYYQYEPDYTNDLNAIHEADKKLFPKFVTDGYGPDTLVAYRGNLDRLCVGHPGGTRRASAAQRCEALCRTLFPERW